jgi:hypothetical protein
MQGCREGGGWGGGGTGFEVKPYLSPPLKGTSISLYAGRVGGCMLPFFVSFVSLFLCLFLFSFCLFFFQIFKIFFPEVPGSLPDKPSRKGDRGQISSHVYNHCIYHTGAWGGGGGVHFFDGGISRKVWAGFMYMSVYSSNSSPQSVRTPAPLGGIYVYVCIFFK